MAVVLFFLIFLPLSIWFAILVADQTSRPYVIRLVLLAWVLFMPLLSAIHSWIPFAGGGDDESYYELADPPIQGLADALDLTRFVSFMEQPGYPWLLSLTNALTGHNLFVYKGLNFFFLLSLSMVWYRIGFILEGATFARRMMLVILLLTPLWNYVFFLLKDISITLLQSLFLLVAIQIWKKPAIRPLFVGAISTLSLLLFRTPLVVQNAAVLFGGVTAKALGRTDRTSRFFPLLIGGVFVTALAPVVTNPEIMAALGILNPSRVIGSADFIGSGGQQGEESFINRSLFPLIYLFSETAGLSPKQWSSFDSFWIRGVLAIPWIFFIVPFFLIGTWKLFNSMHGMPRTYGVVARLRSSRAVNTPWSMVLLFVGISIAISWMVGDTTRWRIPDMPMVAAIALSGWSMILPRIRRQILLGWMTASCSLFLLYYLVSG